MSASLIYIHLLSKIFQFTATQISASDLMRRRERANAFCEAIRALDATGLVLLRINLLSLHFYIYSVFFLLL